jgi:protein phosphatase
MSLRGKIKLAEITDVGKVRDHNEDAIGSDADMGLMVLAEDDYRAGSRRCYPRGPQRS